MLQASLLGCKLNAGCTDYLELQISDILQWPLCSNFADPNLRVSLTLVLWGTLEVNHPVIEYAPYAYGLSL